MSVPDRSVAQHDYISYGGVVFGIVMCTLLFAVWIARKMSAFPQAPVRLDHPSLSVLC
jgi:hypothetical protein